MMQVRRYVAPSYTEALIRAKNELGTEAIIVDSRKVNVGGFMGLFQRPATELTVAIDLPSRPVPMAPPLAVHTEPSVNWLEREMASLRAAVMQLTERHAQGGDTGSGLRGARQKAYEALTSHGVDGPVALEIAGRLAEDAADPQAALADEVVRLLGPAQPIQVTPGRRRVVALVGPTGVGKTTTLAKLAAQFTLERGLKVGLITADTFRIAAIEQLRTYADILGIPLHAVDTPAEMATALRETADCELVLADTAGRSHRDPSRVQELRETLAVLRPDETHLVLSLTAHPREAVEVLECYLPLGISKLALTKLDEVCSPSLILSLRMHSDLPLSYVTCGQSVPDDIVAADRAGIGHILTGG